MQTNRTFIVQNWGEIDYQSAWDRQAELFDHQIALKNAELPTQNTLVLCCHPHVYTIGKSGHSENMLLDDGTVPIVRTNRGGDITYHGPGQIVAYPIFDLDTFALGLKAYIYKVEQAVIELLTQYNIEAGRLDGATGVWLQPSEKGGLRKICAIGVRSSRFVTMHGLALNVNTDLSYFSRINPCGFTDKGVTSMANELGKVCDFSDVERRLITAFESVFSA